jgi:hypothetical protein
MDMEDVQIAGASTRCRIDPLPSMISNADEFEIPRKTG